MQIRSYLASDEEAIVMLWTDCGLVRPWNNPHRDIARKLTQQPELFLVALDKGALIGTAMAGYDGHRGWVNYLAVALSHRKQGVGRLLMTRAEASLTALGCPKLNLQIRSTNQDVIAFYRKLGYTVDDVVSLGRRLIPDSEPPSA